MQGLAALLLKNLCLALLSRLASATADDFAAVVALVREAEGKAALTGEEKRAYVHARLKDLASDIAPFMRDLLVSVAVGYLNRTGVLRLREKPFSLVRK